MRSMSIPNGRQGGNMLTEIFVRLILHTLELSLRVALAVAPSVREKAASRDAVVQIKTRDGKIGRSFEFRRGRLTCRSGVHDAPDATLVFKDAATALKLLS